MACGPTTRGCCTHGFWPPNPPAGSWRSSCCRLPEGAVEEVLSSTQPVAWKAMVRNAKRWSDGTALGFEASTTNCRSSPEKKTRPTATAWFGCRGMAAQVQVSTFAEVLDDLGKTPLPPYMKSVQAEDARPRGLPNGVRLGSRQCGRADGRTALRRRSFWAELAAARPAFEPVDPSRRCGHVQAFVRGCCDGPRHAR